MRISGFWTSGFVSWVMIATLEREKKYTISESERCIEIRLTTESKKQSERNVSAGRCLQQVAKIEVERRNETFWEMGEMSAERSRATRTEKIILQFGGFSD